MKQTDNLKLYKPEMTDAITESVEKVFNKNFDTIDEEVGGLKKYSTAPVKIGTWIDGNPIYRLIFTGNVGADFKTETGSGSTYDGYWWKPWSDITKGYVIDNNIVIPINRQCFADIGHAANVGDCCIDVATEPETSSTVIWINPIDTNGKCSYWGYIEFATPESNIVNLEE